MNHTANKGFSMIKYKIDRVKNPKLYTNEFPELDALKHASKIDVTSNFYSKIRDTSKWGIKNMAMNKSAYHFYDYQKDKCTLVPEQFPGDGKKLEQLKILESAPKPTVYTEGTRLTNYLKKLHHKMMNVDIQYEFNLHLKHPGGDIKSYKEHLDKLTNNLNFLKSHPKPINLETCNLVNLYKRSRDCANLDPDKYY
mmetsp:Transcript_26858/g.23714  ORF Transcript_26858/g.23714 Transcript_26858/m.23714 type:complete len:196 (+) Transcript_26858:363-950(+)